MGDAVLDRQARRLLVGVEAIARDVVDLDAQHVDVGIGKVEAGLGAGEEAVDLAGRVGLVAVDGEIGHAPVGRDRGPGRAHDAGDGFVEAVHQAQVGFAHPRALEEDVVEQMQAAVAVGVHAEAIGARRNVDDAAAGRVRGIDRRLDHRLTVDGGVGDGAEIEWH